MMSLCFGFCLGRTIPLLGPNGSVGIRRWGGDSGSRVARRMLAVKQCNLRMAAVGESSSKATALGKSLESVPTSSTASVPPGIPTFQEAIARLQTYWAEKGCIVWHPYNHEVGAGTMNPATFLRVLGPEPWSVAYDEPSVRPDDSRYGENPNRVQRHTQFQVILKPCPENCQELLLGSYQVLGIDTAQHDVRFVEDNWESPALGAWGLGWEVWLDGMEVTQFTYFQQAGGYSCVPVSLEITYGLERIMMSLQKKSHFKDIVFAPGITYGDIFMQNEVEMSMYNLTEASIERSAILFDAYEKEGLAMIEKRLPVPAYNFLLKASHTFNILDARGAIGVTERAAFHALGAQSSNTMIDAAGHMHPQGHMHLRHHSSYLNSGRQGRESCGGAETGMEDTGRE